MIAHTRNVTELRAAMSVGHSTMVVLFLLATFRNENIRLTLVALEISFMFYHILPGKYSLKIEKSKQNLPHG